MGDNELIRVGFSHRQADAIQAEIAALAGGGGGGGAPKGTRDADAWGFLQTNAAGTSQARASGGWDFRAIPVGANTPPVLTDVAVDAFAGDFSHDVGLPAVGWYDVRIYLKGQFTGTKPPSVQLGFNYAGQGQYNFPSWRIVPDSAGKIDTIQSYGLVYIKTAGDALKPYLLWATADPINFAQFSFQVTAL
jgi:hypothetical protein